MGNEGACKIVLGRSTIRKLGFGVGDGIIGGLWCHELRFSSLCTDSPFVRCAEVVGYERWVRNSLD